jgi:rubrerythrin
MTSIQYNADEIFRMAEQIERNGSIFYTKAAAIVTDEQMKTLMGNLAEWELEHEQTFAKLREDFLKLDQAPQDATDADDIAGAYLRSIADGYVFDTKTQPEDLLKGDEDAETILRIAIGQEKNSIVFYLGMQKDMPDEFGHDRLDKIIQEEMRHITILSDQIKQHRAKNS